jgi:hypothetical protein
MTNALKSKIAKAGLGLVAAASMLIGAASVSAYTFTPPNLKVGSVSDAVVQLQTALGVSPTSMHFGPKTLAAVKAYQTAHGITPTGTVGPLTMAALNAGGGTTMTYPAGCTSSTGFSTTTGMSCAGSTVTLPAGCTSTDGFSPTTGMSCAGTGTGVVTSGSLSAALSTDNPAAGTIVAGQATADLAHFTFTGTGTVNSITLKRSGISDQNTLANVYLFNGTTRLTDGYSFNNTGTLTMNGLNLMVIGSMTISVKADVGSCGAGVSCYSLGVNLTSFTAAGGSATAANLMGNVMYIATGTSIATVYMDPANQTVGETAGTLCTTACPTVNAGTSAYTVWSETVQVGSRAVWLKGANFRMVGSAPSSSLSNIKLYVDGVATGAMATLGTIGGSNYAMFNFTSPVSLTTGGHTFDVRADVTGGSSYTVQVSLQQASDLVVFDPQVGVNILPAKNSTTSFVAVNAGTITINGGSASVVVDPAFSAMTNITGGATTIDIAKFKVHGYSEDVKVSSLSVTPNIINVTSAVGACTSTNSAGTPTGTCGLANVAVYFNGSQVGSSQNWTSPAASSPMTFNLGSQMILAAGTDSTIEIKADLQTLGGANYTTGTVNAQLVLGASNAQGQTSHATLNFPSSTVVGTTLTVQTGLLAVSKNSGYTNQVVNPNTVGVKGGSFILQNQSTAEAVHVTNLSFALALPAATTWSSGTTNTTATQTWVLSQTAALAGITAGNVLTLASNAGCTTVPVMTVLSVSGSTLTSVSSGNTASAGGACTAATAVVAVSPTSLATLTNFSNLKTSETSGSGANPILPTATNNFSVDFVLAPGATKTIDMFYDTSSANMGTLIPTLTVTSLGMSSHVAITQTGAGTGQTITFGAGSVNTPTVVTSTSTQGQNIAGGSTTGVTDATRATFNVTATNGTATISELKFKNTGTSGTVTNVRVGTVSAPTVTDIAYLTGLAIVVPNGGAGMNLDAYASYAPVGSTGVSSGGTAVLQLCSIKYTIGGTTSTSGDTTCASPLLSSGQTMKLYGSKPTITVATPVGAVVSPSSSVEAIDVTIAADAAGPITVVSFPVNTTIAGLAATTANFTTADFVVKDEGNNTISTATGGCGATTACTNVTVTLNSTTGYLIAAGTSKTFKVFVNTGAYTVPTTSLPNTFLYSSVGGTGVMSWLDTAGSSTSAITGVTSIYNYPSTTTIGVHN